jgi:GNAT superfamily N-acetyltransferase
VCKLVHIRAADIKDRDNVWPLARDFASSFVLERTCFDASFDLLLTRRDTLLLIAERSQDDVIGYLLAFGHATFLANGPVAWVEEIMVAEQARRTGVGRKLMEAAERWSSFRRRRLPRPGNEASSLFLPRARLSRLGDVLQKDASGRASVKAARQGPNQDHEVETR